jgi:hypothetical protein
LRDESKTKKQLIDELIELRRQMAEFKASADEHKHSGDRRPARVGEILIEMGCLTRLQLERALRKQKEADMRGDSHIPVGRILAESGIITAEQLQTALAEQRVRLGRRVE